MFIKDWPDFCKSETTPSDFCPISGDWGDLGTSVSNKMLLNMAKCHGYSFYCFWVNRGKPTGGVKLPLGLNG